MMVLPAPASSASRKRNGSCGSIRSYTAMRWCGSGSMRAVSAAKAGLNWWPWAKRNASATADTAAGLPAKSKAGAAAAEDAPRAEVRERGLRARGSGFVTPIVATDVTR